MTILPAGRSQPSAPPLYTIEKTAEAKKGMVVTAHPLASQVGIRILRKGGNAADAAVAVQFALAVVYPRAGNLGGGGFLVHRNEEGLVRTLDFREKAPAAASRDMYLDDRGNVIAGISTAGPAAAGIPGSVAGLAETYRVLGKYKNWQALVKPAIRLARKGFRITALEADRLNRFRPDFLTHNPWPMPFVREKSWQEGDRLRQPELAATLARIARAGASGFYKGPAAAALTNVMSNHGGYITQEDLDAYQAVWRDPVRIEWKEYTLYTMGLPSSGGILLQQILSMIEDQLRPTGGPRDVHNIHLIAEAERRAFADRAKYLGDGDMVQVPMDTLMSAAYARRKMHSFDPEKASRSESIEAAGEAPTREHFETTHASIVDRFGQAAAVTTTLNDNYGCKVWVPGGGYFLNNEMDDFSAKPGVPNIFGLVGGEANAIAPAKRPLSSMTPTVVERDGKLWLVLGTPGGSTIITSVLQVFLNAGPFGLSLEQAVQAPRFHHQCWPDRILSEPDAFEASVQKELQAMGHKLETTAYIGLMEAIGVARDGRFLGVADRRGDDHASGW